MIHFNAYRLPEELNGDRCFGGSLVDVLRGYGYDVHASVVVSSKLLSASSRDQENVCDCPLEDQNGFGNSISR